MQEPKKISFGFSKISKKPLLVVPKQEKGKVQFIESVEEKAIKIKDAVEEVYQPLVIPIKQSRNLQDRIKAAREKTVEVKKEEIDDRPDNELTLDELAARELLKEARNRVKEEPKENNTLILPGIDADANEPTLNDYESIPISDFGKAMLRGMGWKETDKSSMASEPELRPKGLGLGANKLVKSENAKNAKDDSGKELQLVKGAFVKIIAGTHKGNYCEVQGLDDEAGRIIVKTALKSEILTLNEFLLVTVTKDEFSKNSKILNNAMYEEYLEKQKHSSSVKEEEKSTSESDSDRNRRKNRKDKSKYRDRSRSRERKHKKKSSRHRSSSSSDTEHSRKSKKNKCKSRHRRSDSDSGRESRKSRKTRR